MKEADIQKWLYKFPIAGMQTVFHPYTWREDGALNEKIVQRIKDFPVREFAYIFGNDLSFSIKNIDFPERSPFFLSERRKFSDRLDRLYEKTSDEWLLKKKREIAKFRPQEIMMLSFHGIMDPENPGNKNRIIPGSVSDITEYRFGTKPYGEGYYDHPYSRKKGKKEGDLEIRVLPMPALEFIAAYNRTLFELTTALAKFDPGYETAFLDNFESHLNISPWRDGAPFKGGINIFDFGTEEDLDLGRKMVSGLCSWQMGEKAGPSRFDGIRLARGRAEVRELSDVSNSRGLHIARCVLEAIVFMEAALYGIKNVDAPGKDTKALGKATELQLVAGFPGSRIAERTIFNGERWLGFMLSVATINDDGSLDCRHHYGNKEWLELGEELHKLNDIVPAIRVKKSDEKYVFSLLPDLLPEKLKKHKYALEQEMNETFIKTIPTIINKGLDIRRAEDPDLKFSDSITRPVFSILLPDITLDTRKAHMGNMAFAFDYLKGLLAGSKKGERSR